MTSRPIKLMLVATHPSDCFDQAGGTLAHHVAKGDSVTVVLATTGVRSHHNQLQDERRVAGAELDVEKRVKEAIEQKLEETRNACRILGFDDIRPLGFEDDDILVSQDKIEAVATEIRNVRPDILITHHPYEGGSFKMHATIGQCTLYAWQLAMGVGRSNETRHNVPILYFMNPMAYMGHNSLKYAGTSDVTVSIDITDVVDKKVKAMDFVSSQYYGGAYARKCAETGDGAHGQTAGVAYSEHFQSFLPMVRYTLPICERNLDFIEEPGDVVLGRRAEIVGAHMPLPPGMEFTSKYRVPKEKYDD
ncbi:MAG: PIG-L family deacetylase [Actinomycetia bacterium]|nr:PIG-L family deacetylase [Actinomycetes bacterium]